MAFAAAALPVIAIGLGVAGAVVNTTATIAANNYQSEVLARNAALMEQNAQRSVQAASAASLQQDQMTRALLGEQIATQSASGLKIGGKSQMLTRKSARELGRLDAENIRYAGDVEAFNYRQLAQDAESEIQFRKQSNTFALLGGFLDAGGAVIGGLRQSPSLTNSLLGTRKSSVSTAGLKIGGSGTTLRFAR